MNLRTLGIAALAMFGAGIGIFTAALCWAAGRNPTNPIDDNTGYPGTPTGSTHPSRQATNPGGTNPPPTPEGQA